MAAARNTPLVVHPAFVIKPAEEMSPWERRQTKRSGVRGAFKSLFRSSERGEQSSSRPVASKERPVPSPGGTATVSLPARTKVQVDVSSRSSSAAIAGWQPERPDHNVHFLPSQSETGSPPEWYIKEVTALPGHHPDYLCATCRHINLEHLFYRTKSRSTATPREYIYLGPLPEIAEQTNCGLCRIVTETIRLRVKLDTERGAGKLDYEARRLLSAKWYLSPFVYAHEQYGRGWQLYLRHSVFDADQQADTIHTLPSHPFALRLIINRGRGGRRIAAGHLDFSWIKTTIDRCEISTQMPPRKFDYPIRVIDTLDMCIVDLGIGDQYVALSYPWGKVNQLKLVQQNETLLRQPGGLSQLFGQLARTIQDAIVLVSKVSVRYLWLDSLCIVQDDKDDMKEQMAQMGEIYLYSHFTICAISGQDANYGLPGVRQGSRKLTQVLEEVAGLTIANSLPFMEEDDLLTCGAWGSRAWTFQERFRAQRGLFIGDDGMIINCWHVFSPEDEHCWHTLTRDERFLATGQMNFFAGQDKRCVPYLGMKRTRFDYFAQYIYEYTQRKLTHQSDALPAFLGVLSSLKSRHQSEFPHGIPEVEFDAGLLWTPLGSSVRRPMYPSWSWLGWNGTAAYPWTHERDTFFSTETLPLKWLDANVAEEARHEIPQAMIDEGNERHSRGGYLELKETKQIDAAWFTSDDLCLPASTNKEMLLRYWRKQTHDHLGCRRSCRNARTQADWKAKYSITWPEGQEPRWKYAVPWSHRLTFRTLSAHFYVVGSPFQRKKLYNVKHPIWRLAVCDETGNLAGYIDIPDPNSGARIRGGSREFVVLSRSTIDGRIEPAPGPLEERRQLPIGPEPTAFGRAPPKEIEEVMNLKRGAARVNERGGFDTRVYDETRPWCMFNVLMLTRTQQHAYRDAIGRIHVDAFLAHRPTSVVTELE